MEGKESRGKGLKFRENKAIHDMHGATDTHTEAA